MTDLKELIEREIDQYLEWPTADKSHVTTASAKLFAEHVATLYADHIPDAGEMVAPAVQGEPVAYAVFSSNGNIRMWCADPVQGETLRHQYGGALQPLYTAPQPELDVSTLVGALEDIAGTHHHSASAGEYFAKVARAALAEARGES